MIEFHWVWPFWYDLVAFVLYTLYELSGVSSCCQKFAFANKFYCILMTQDHSGNIVNIIFQKLFLFSHTIRFYSKVYANLTINSHYLSIYLSICRTLSLSIYIYIYIYIYMYICNYLYVNLSLFISIILSFLSLSLSFSLSLSIYIHIYIYTYPNMFISIIIY